jgi:hypothetical protein
MLWATVRNHQIETSYSDQKVTCARVRHASRMLNSFQYVLDYWFTSPKLSNENIIFVGFKIGAARKKLTG